MLQEIIDEVSSASGFLKLRRAIQSTSPPSIPYLGLTLTDLTFIQYLKNLLFL